MQTVTDYLNTAVGIPMEMSDKLKKRRCGSGSRTGR
jgi:hypothetical protein